ncbi:MAG: PINc/VapC family ATPase [Nitrosopumilus sp.]|nr:PINc/VapC family ATPase [Nitrosopumilus sp.]MDA7958106.1 PINc/VapC family ATPase [Nitrosopumilus sp.]
MKIVPDTSVIINGRLLAQVESGSLRGSEVIIPQAALDELRSQAAAGREQGYVGLEKVGRLKAVAEQHGIAVSVRGRHPTAEEVGLAGGGRIDALISDLAAEEGAVLYTSDAVQHMAAQATGPGSVMLRAPAQSGGLRFERYFDGHTMSVHLKERRIPLAKRGRPGAFELEEVGDAPLERREIEGIASEIFDAAGSSDDGSVDMSMTGASVVQLGTYRIAITHPPFSEAFEITIVHPIARMSLEEYGVSEKLMERFAGGAEGIVISGAPGSGKSTLASGLANFYHSRRRIVKTLESPRDLQVDPGITQYGRLEGSFENAAEMLLLVRPDYTIFDEVRRREDFATFADLRLTGVGMVGVIHASSPIDAIQRFVGKIELGIIPSVLDTVVFVRDGSIQKVYGLELKVKVPSGMTESDLARPVIEIRDFAGGELEHEIYTFGEENVIVPVSGRGERAGLDRLAEERIREVFSRYDPGASVEAVSGGRARVTVDASRAASIIGRGGSNISGIERSLGVKIDVVPRGRDAPGGGAPGGPAEGVPFKYSETRGAVILDVGLEHASTEAEVMLDGRLVALRRVGRRGLIKIPRHSGAGRTIADSPSEIRVLLRGS